MILTAFLGLGSNLGDKKHNCERAAALLKEHPHIRIVKTSSWHVTKALALKGETHPDFLNGVVQIATDLSAENLAAITKTIEWEMGRKPCEKKWQPRPIDIDILFYAGQITDTPHLKIPHPQLHKRLFILEPFCEIAPNWIHPVLKKTVGELLKDMLKEQQ